MCWSDAGSIANANVKADADGNAIANSGDDAIANANAL